jgi:uncharacterized protein YbjQ (UPF0145 family)
MNLRRVTVGIILAFSFATSAFAADTLIQLQIEDAINDLSIKSQLSSGIQLFWGDQKHPEPKTVFGEYKTSQRTNALGKSREDACQWALASSLKELQARAHREGGNAVVNIKSNIKNVEKSSTTEYDCLAGRVMVNVALKGTVVKLPE